MSDASASPTEHVAIAVRARRSPRLLLGWTSDGVHLGRARDLPVAEILASDVAAAAHLGLEPAEFAALRLVASLGFAPAGAATLEPDGTELRTRATTAESFEAYLRAHDAVAWARAASVVGRFEARGDVLRGVRAVVEIVVDETAAAPPPDTTWCDESAVVAAWADATELPSPALALVLARRGDALLRERGLVTSAWEVAPGLAMIPLRTPTIAPATHTNAFLLGTEHALLVEPASPYEDEIDRLVAMVDARRAGGLVLDGILLTHHHPDHVGGAMALRDRLGVPILAHARTQDRLRGQVEIDRTVADGERLRLEGPLPMELELIHTPGHAPGHICVLERSSGALLAGDMVAGVGTILVEPYDGDMRLYLDSLERLRRRGSSMILPAHGGVVRDPNVWLSHYVAHRLAREAKIVAGLATLGAPSNLDELVPIAYADTSPMAWPLARMASAAHLDKLVAEGRVTRTGERFELVRGAAGSVM